MHKHDKQSRHMFGGTVVVAICVRWSHSHMPGWTQHSRGDRLYIVQHSFDKLRRLIKRKAKNSFSWKWLLLFSVSFFFVPNTLLEDHYVCFVKLIRICHWWRENAFVLVSLRFCCCSIACLHCVKFAICSADRTIIVCSTESRVQCQWVNGAARAFLRQRKTERAKKHSEMKLKRTRNLFRFFFHLLSACIFLSRTPAPVCHSLPTPLGRWNEIVIGECIFFFGFLRFGTFTLDYDDGGMARVWETLGTVHRIEKNWFVQKNKMPLNGNSMEKKSTAFDGVGCGQRMSSPLLFISFQFFGIIPMAKLNLVGFHHFCCRVVFSLRFDVRLFRNFLLFSPSATFA